MDVQQIVEQALSQAPALAVLAYLVYANQQTMAKITEKGFDALQENTKALHELSIVLTAITGSGDSSKGD